ncbi:MAG: SAM-dependent chlorinase/fluorinase [Sedimentisphaerales bacterium]|nr:SAM-dependent chlorinase/fluorinase [Sedimentisphaerales bacterium]
MIVLLTDFGLSEYVGVMKGIIGNISEDLKVVDLCHNVSPQNLIEASWILSNNYNYFPANSVFCCVVDPGVGTARKAIAVKTEKYYFVGPDNGLLWETLKEQKVVEIRTLEIPENASRTFHGRDVFAVAAANIVAGRFENIGKKQEKVEKMELFQNGNEGIIVRVDTFGNVVTNIPCLQKEKYQVETGRKQLKMNFYPNYASAKDNELFLIEGSNKTLEISLKNANANNILQLKTGQRVIIS